MESLIKSVLGPRSRPKTISKFWDDWIVADEIHRRQLIEKLPLNLNQFKLHVCPRCGISPSYLNSYFEDLFEATNTRLLNKIEHDVDVLDKAWDHYLICKDQASQQIISAKIDRLKTLWGSVSTTTVQIVGTSRTGKSQYALRLASLMEDKEITAMLNDILGVRS